MTLIILMYALYACSFPISKVLVQYAPPFFLTGIRMSLGGAILLIYQYIWQHEHFRLKVKHIKYFAQIILIGIVLHYSLRYWAMQYLPSSKAAFLFNFSPFMSSFYSYLIFKERMTKKQWLGLAIGFLGLIPIIVSSSPAEARVGEWFFISWPELAILACVALHSYTWIVVRKLVRFKNYSPIMINGVSMFCGGLIALLISTFVEGFYPVTNSPNFFLWLGVIIVTSNIICRNLYGFLLKKYTATFLSFAGFLSPLFAALYGWGLLGEKITWHFGLSAAIVFIGLYLFYKDEITPPNFNPETV